MDSPAKDPRELFALLQLEETAEAESYQQILVELEKEAFKPNNLKSFLRILGEQPAALRGHFYKEILVRRRNSIGALKTLEKHLRWCLNRDRKDAHSSLEAIGESKALPGLFRLVSLTRDATVAREIIARIRTYDYEHIRSAILYALRSEDKKLQSFGLHMARRVTDPTLIEPLLKFYLQQTENTIKANAQRVLLEALTPDDREIVLGWLRDKNGDVRLLGVRAAQRLADRKFIPDLVRLVLVDARTRVSAASVLLSFAQLGIITFVPDGAPEITGIITKAKRQPLLAVLEELLHNDNRVLREIGLRFLRLLPEERTLEKTVVYLAQRERTAPVRSAAIELLATYQREQALDMIVEILSDPAASARNSSLAQATEELLAKLVDGETLAQIEAKIEKRREEREEALNRFVGDFEAWREQL
ncbi:MAG: hypothetical protein ACOYD6_03600 [Limnochordia bacterium]|jgi:hypothetical protein